ncbi:MAG: hypothetical protein M0P18_10835 [Syntrophales bacterium]|nr:hypothetical protein [Syntrophales bacterium]
MEWTKKRARQYTRLRIATAKESLTRAAGYWGDLDYSVIDAIDQAIAALDEIGLAMDDAVGLEEDGDQ